MPRPRVMMVITKAEAGGAQVHVRDVIVGLREHVDFSVAVGDDGFLTDALRDVVPVHIVPDMQWAIRLRQDARGVRALRRLFTTQRPDLVHTHSTKAGLLGRIAAALAGIPAVHTAHSWAFSDGIAWARKAYAIPTEALVARRTARFIVVSEADREVGLRYGVAREAQVRVIHNGVPDTPCRAQPASPGTPVIVTVARMAPPKDYRLLLGALARVSAPFALRVIGDGPDRASISVMLTELALTDRVALLGTRADVPEQLASAHVFTLISRQEGFPLSVLEGMRAGLPIIASDVGGVREAVDSSVGALIARGDGAALTRAFDRLLADAKLRETLGAAARARYEQRFTVAGMCDRTLAVYRELCPA